MYGLGVKDNWMMSEKLDGWINGWRKRNNEWVDRIVNKRLVYK